MTDTQPPTLTRRWWRDPTRRRRAAAALIVAACVGTVLAFALDYAVWAMLYEREYRESDKFRLLKAAGYLPTWLLMGAALLMIDWPLNKQHGPGIAARRGALLMGAAAASGAASELLKLVFRRARPPKPPSGEWASVYDFVPYSASDHVLSTAGLSMPSSHTAIAFGACWMLCLLFPRAWPVWLFVAGGCGLTRLLDHAHHLSDVYVSAVAAGVIALALWTWYEHMIVKWKQADARAAAAKADNDTDPDTPENG